MASARSFALSALRSNISRQSRGAIAQKQFPHGLAKAQPIQRALRPAFVPVRWHSAPSGRSKDYDFSAIRELSSSPSPERLLIGKQHHPRTQKPTHHPAHTNTQRATDVREPSEYEAGFIPGALNIPVKSQPDAMFLPEDEFEDRFGFSKPAMDKELVFYCKAGVRSSAAAQLAKQVGYTNVAEYRGSWMDWEKNGGEAGKP